MKDGRIVIRPTADELAWLIEQTAERGVTLDMRFGPSGAWFEENPNRPSEAARLLAWKRGVGTKGMDGEGI